MSTSRFPQLRLSALRLSVRGASVALAVLLISACSTLTSTTPSGPGTGSVPSTSELTGTLRNVDHGNRRLLLGTDAGSTADIGYDDSTRVTGAQATNALAPGDKVRVVAAMDSRLWRARSIEKLSARQGSSPAQGGATRPAATDDAPVERSGAVSSIDPRAGTISYTEGGVTGGTHSARLTAQTRVTFQGQPYPLKSVRSGDMIRLWVKRSEQGWVAERVVLTARAQDR